MHAPFTLFLALVLLVIPMRTPDSIEVDSATTRECCCGNNGETRCNMSCCAASSDLHHSQTAKDTPDSSCHCSILLLAVTPDPPPVVACPRPFLLTFLQAVPVPPDGRISHPPKSCLTFCTGRAIRAVWPPLAARQAFAYVLENKRSMWCRPRHDPSAVGLDGGPPARASVPSPWEGTGVQYPSNTQGSRQ